MEVRASVIEVQSRSTTIGVSSARLLILTRYPGSATAKPSEAGMVDKRTETSTRPASRSTRLQRAVSVYGNKHFVSVLFV